MALGDGKWRCVGAGTGLGVAILLSATALWADTRADLAAQIIAAGRNDTEMKRHAVSIEECEMTTWVYKPYEDKGMQLWSSFVFDMRFAKLSADTPELFIGERGETGEGRIPNEFAVILFQMQGRSVARHEVPEFRRKRDLDRYRPSPRQGQVPYFFRDSTSFVILQDGPGVFDKAGTFTKSYERYVAEYCLVLG